MLLAVCLASTLVVGMAAGAEPAKCCFDKQFTAKMGEFGGYVSGGHPYHIEGRLDLSYDFYRRVQQTVAHMRRKNSTEVDTTFELKDYTKRRTYKWAHNMNCTWTRMAQTEEMIPPCVPDNARFLGTATAGYGLETLTINSWEFWNQGFRVQMALTPSCVPVVETVLIEASEISLFWSGYRPGIETDIHPPAHCTRALMFFKIYIYAAAVFLCGNTLTYLAAPCRRAPHGLRKA